jgi:hypothetical protein
MDVEGGLDEYVEETDSDYYTEAGEQEEDDDDGG